jgi:hypothetical protein
MSPRTPSIEDAQSFSVRLPAALVIWVDEMAQAHKISRAEIVRRLCEDAATWYGLPANIAEVLRQDCRAQGFDDKLSRDYILNLLGERYSAIARGDAKPAYSPNKKKKQE